MKIGLVILHADAARGGAERYTLDIAAALAQQAHDVTLIASSFGDSIDPRVAQVTLELTGRSKTGRYVEFLDQLDAHLLAASYDVVHAMLPVRRCDVYHPHAGLAAAAIEQGHEKHRGIARPVAKLLNQLNPKRQRFAAVERELLSQPHPPLVICLSNYVKRSVRQYYPHNEADLVTLFNAVDLQKYDPHTHPEIRQEMRRALTIHDDQIAALIVANDFERKGVRETIVGLAKSDEPKLKLVVVGQGNLNAYRQIAESSKVSDRVQFFGPAKDVYPHYCAADFFVLPTRHDPCSLVVLEALAMGLPVISTKQNGATEIMENGVDGFILDEEWGVDELGAVMKKLCDPNLRQRMRDACLVHRQRLNFNTHMEQLTRIYQSAVERRAPHP